MWTKLGAIALLKIDRILVCHDYMYYEINAMDVFNPNINIFSMSIYEKHL